MNKIVRIVIVDDHEVVRSGLRAYLSSQPGFQVIGEAATGEEAIELAKELPPDVMLMDLLLPTIDGVKTTREIKKIYPRIQIILLTSSADDELIFSAIIAGASACIFKDMKMESLTNAIRKVLIAEATIHPRIAAMILKKYHRGKTSKKKEIRVLTTIEIKILSLLEQGYSNRKIAERTSISESEVEDHLRKILIRIQNTKSVGIALTNSTPGG